ncbi:hypothetical protein QBC34DRAFT_414549 [Podospora aff. communis PSN243]|jgi:hypothetical protein|uniref:NTF2-like domain-containing protein n=1 Tax=Podospora aff. communis PSN243 TaxID=3040156 RepID=A0AAV9G980_9PEZI|nr:hypothetical protein QBC34DRAFT_414549 [Podospora aff. communis PSN243]
MRFFSILTLATSVSAGLLSRHGDRDKCLKQRDVDGLVEAYKSILSAWDPAKADFLADENFFGYSDSINTVAGIGTGFPIFPNKQAFVDRQNASPDNLPLTIVEVGPWNCNQITVIWSATFTKVPGGTPLPVRGIVVLESNWNKKQKQFEIQNIKVEFNSMNFFRNTGGICERR